MSKNKIRNLAQIPPVLKNEIVWVPERIRLGDIVPWENNPRQMTKSQAEKILASFEEFGQAKALAIGPENQLYDGHQRYFALVKSNGEDWEIDVMRSSRALTDEERRKLTLLLHAGAVGDWDWDMLGEWDKKFLVEHGLDEYLIGVIGGDVSAIISMRNAGDELFTPTYEPASASGLVTNDSIERAMKREAGRFNQDIKTREFRCPKCGGRFFINVAV